jgi:glycosyltransferase 2 family protein
MKKNKKTSLILVLVAIVIVTTFIFYIYANRERYIQLLNFSTESLIFIFILSFLSPILNSFQNAYLYRDLGVAISFKESLNITTVSTLANLLPISGGVLSKGFYLKKKFGLSYTVFASSTMALFVCFIGVNGLLGLFVLLYLFFFTEGAVSPILLIGYSLMLFSFLVFWLPIQKLRLTGKLNLWFGQAVDGWNIIGKNPLLLFKLSVLQIILNIFLAFRYMVSFDMLSQKITIAQALLMSTASIITQLASIAPGGLGVREAIVGSVAAILGFDAGVSIVAVGLDRLVSTIVIVLAGLIGTVFLSNDIFDKSYKWEDEI